MEQPAWKIEFGDGPLVAAAIHDGGAVRPEVAERLALSETRRRHEEDPHTAVWTAVAPTRIIGLRSRFEVDLNRPREQAVYLQPDDAWGLHVWESPPPPEVVEGSLALHDAFYAQVREMLERWVARFGKVVIYDIHSYNHRRQGPQEPPADPQANPEINVGTGSMNRAYWAPVVERFIDELHGFDYFGRRLDVRENVRFRGGYFPRWVHEHFPESVCALAIEVKKFYMDEWSGEPYPERIEAVGRALDSTVDGVLEELPRL